MFNFNRNQSRSSASRNKGGFWSSMWSAGAFAALVSFTFSMLAIVYLTRDAIESNDEMIMRACLASPLFLLAGILSLGLMAKQAARYFADGFHANNQPVAPQLPMASHAETIDAIARLVTSQQAQVYQVQQAQLGQAAAVPMLPAPTRLLMDALRDEECILVHGPKGSGKTTVLLHVIRDRLMRGHEVRVFDPHSAPNKWLGAQAIGGGRKYEIIEGGLLEVVRLMTQRYDEIASGEVVEGDHPYLTVLIDEYRSIVMNTDEVKEAIKTLLTEARKVNIHIVVVSHSKRVKALGFKGEGDLIEGLCQVHLTKDENRVRRCEVVFNFEKPIEMALPGPFRRDSQYRTSSIPTSQQADTKPIPTPKAADTKPVSANTSQIPVKKELSVTEIVEELRQRGKSEAVIAKYLAKKYPKLSANAISKMSKLSRNKALAIVKAARMGADSKQKTHTNGHKNGRVI